MSYAQRDLVFVTLKNPSGQEQKHPYLIISNRLANEKQNYYIGVMMTSTNFKDRFSFPATESMFEGSLYKHGCNFRINIISSFSVSQVERLITRMKLFDFRKLLDEIKDSVFTVDAY